MGDDSAGSGLELGWKRAGRCAGVGLLRSARRGRAVLQGCPAGLSLLAACLASAAKQHCWPRTAAPPLERLDGIQPPVHRPVEAVKPGSRGRRCLGEASLSRALFSRGVSWVAHASRHAQSVQRCRKQDTRGDVSITATRHAVFSM